MEVESEARAQTEAALKQKGWVPRGWDGMAVDADAPSGGYSVRAYPADGPNAPREAFCRVDDWTAKENDTVPYLWLVGVPRPEKVPELFRRYPKVTGWSEVGKIGHEVLDFVTGMVIKEHEAQRLMKDPALEIMPAEQKSIGEHEGVFRELVAAGWKPEHMEVSPGENRIVHVIFAWGRYYTGRRCPCGEGTLHESLLLRVDLSESGVSEISAYEPGRGVASSIARRTGGADVAIPTPDEALSALFEELRRARTKREQNRQDS